MTQFQQKLLAVLNQLGGDSYAVPIHKELGPWFPLTRIYSVMDKLEEQGLVESRLEDADEGTRGGNSRKHWKITQDGRDVVESFEETDAWGNS